MNIGHDQAGALTFTLLHGANIYAAGAGGYGRKRRSAQPVPIALQLVTKGPQGNPNKPANQRTTIPLGRTRTKQGYQTDTQTLFGASNAGA